MWQLQMHAFWQQNFISSLGPRGLLNHPPALKMAICLNKYSFVKMTNSYHDHKCFFTTEARRHREMRSWFFNRLRSDFRNILRWLVPTRG